MKPETALPAARVGGMRWALEAGVHMSLDATPRKPDDERASAAAPDADDDDDDDDEQAGARLRGYAIVAAVAPTRAPPPWRAELVGGRVVVWDLSVAAALLAPPRRVVTALIGTPPLAPGAPAAAPPALLSPEAAELALEQGWLALDAAPDAPTPDASLSRRARARRRRAPVAAVARRRARARRRERRAPPPRARCPL